jgi:hypothetical protein
MTSASTAAGFSSAAARAADNATSTTAIAAPAVFLMADYVVRWAVPMRKWLARLSFSFIILTVFFAWEGYRTRRGDRGPGQEAKMYAFFTAAAVSFALGLVGVRERHRRDDQQPPPG